MFKGALKQILRRPKPEPATEAASTSQSQETQPHGDESGSGRLVEVPWPGYSRPPLLLTDASQPALGSQLFGFHSLFPMTLALKGVMAHMAAPYLEELRRKKSHEPGRIGLGSRPCTQGDLESNWSLFWADQLHEERKYHRKLWEYTWTLQLLQENGLLSDGASGIGFGVGSEPLPSYFASKGVTVLATDQPMGRDSEQNWAPTGQWARAVEDLFYADLVPRTVFDRLVRFQEIDMRQLPEFPEWFDFCWSICAIEHLGSKAEALAFLDNALQLLKPGGLLVHTTELNVTNDPVTVDHWPTVIFSRDDLSKWLHDKQREGHEVLPVSWDTGERALDLLVDVPPYRWDETDSGYGPWKASDAPHLKIDIDGAVVTCFGIAIRRGHRG